MENYNTILVRQMCLAGRGARKAAAVITPGSLLMRIWNQYVIPHNLPGGPFQQMFALEKEGQSIDVSYNIDESVDYKICRAGDNVYAFLESGQAVDVGDFLESAGNGVLRKYQEGHVIGLALEAGSASSGDTRFLIEIT